MRFAHLLAVGAALAVLAAGATSASAQTLGDVLGTTILNDTLAGTVLPNLTQTVPDPGSDQQTQTQTQQQTTATTQPAATPAPSGRALGYYCRSESKKHAAGKKTPFAQCVAAMRSLRTGKTKSPFTACRALTHKRAPGTKHSPFALCIAGAKQLLADRTTGSAARR